MTNWPRKHTQVDRRFSHGRSTVQEFHLFGIESHVGPTHLRAHSWHISLQYQRMYRTSQPGADGKSNPSLPPAGIIQRTTDLVLFDPSPFFGGGTHISSTEVHHWLALSASSC